MFLFLSLRFINISTTQWHTEHSSYSKCSFSIRFMRQWASYWIDWHHSRSFCYWKWTWWLAYFKWTFMEWEQLQSITFIIKIKKI